MLFTGLWVGPVLSDLARLCIKSFLDHGHEFQLFTYTDYKGLPEACKIRDARDIIPEKDIFKSYAGGLCAFSDWFRWAWLCREGGVWTDMDVICLSPNIELPDVWFATEDAGKVGVSFMKFPPGHIVAEVLSESAEDPAWVTPWDKPRQKEAKAAFMRMLPNVEARRKHTPWGYCGPHGLTTAVAFYGLQNCAAPTDTIYPVHYDAWRSFYDGSLQLSDSIFSNAFALHVWGFKRRVYDPNIVGVKGSIIHELFQRHFN